MKIVLFCAIALLGLGTISNAQTTLKVTKIAGSAKGFDHIDQKTDAEGNTTITCSGAGLSKCEYVEPPKTDNKKAAFDPNKVIQYVDNQISKGKLGGTAQIEGLIAKWSGTDLYNYTLTAVKIESPVTPK